MHNAEALPPYVTSPETASNYIPEALLASESYISARQVVMRCLAAARLRDRRETISAGRTFNADEWVPDAERLYHLGDAEQVHEPVPGAHRVGRFLGMAANMAAYKERVADIGLREEDQVEPFEAMLDFYHPAEPGEQLPLDVTLAHVLGGAYGKMATGWGKMPVLAKYAEAAGIGQHPFDDPSIPPYKAMVLAGDKINLKQLIGTDVHDGFARFAPTIRLTPYMGAVKDFTGDGVVMPYLMWQRATKEERYNPDDYDLLLSDEAHHLLGKEMRACLQSFKDLGIPGMAVTATPNYSDKHKLDNILAYEVCDIDKRDLIDIGTLSALQLFWVSTGNEIKVRKRRGEYTESEVHDLAHHEGRNKLILDWVKVFVEDGMQVVVTCIRGDQCWHSRHLVELASHPEYTVLDQKTGETRPLIAKTVHGYMSDKSFDFIMAEWAEGKVDVLMVTDKLREAWNTARLGAMVLAAPTTSLLVEDQWIGRAARKNSEVPIKPIVYFDDTVIGYKPQITPYHVLGLRTVDQGIIVGKGGISQPSASKKTHRATSHPEPNTAPGTDGNAPARRALRNLSDYPQGLAETLQVDGILLETVVLTARAEAYKPPPKDFIPVKDTEYLWQNQGLNTICNLLAKNGYEYVVAHGRRGPMRHMHRDGKTFLENYKLPEFAPKHYVTGTLAAIACGVSVAYFAKISEELGQRPADYRSRKTGQVYPFYSPDDVAAVIARNAEQASDSTETTLRAIGAEFGLGLTSVMYHMRHIPGEPLAVTPKRTATSKMAYVVGTADAERLRAYLAASQVTPANRRQPLPAIVAATGAARWQVLGWVSAMAERGLLSRGFRRGRVQNPETGHIESEKILEYDDAQRVVNALAYYRQHGGERYAPAPKNWSDPAVVLQPVRAYKTPIEAVVTASAQEAARTRPKTESVIGFMERTGCTPPAMTYLLGAASITKKDIVQHDEQTYVHSEGLLRMRRLAEAARQRVAADDWMSNTAFAQRMGWKPEVALKRIRTRVGISEGEMHLAMSRQGDAIDIWYAPGLWRRAYNALQENPF